MRNSPRSAIESQSGISIVGIIIILSLLALAYNAYAYFNPDTMLSRYSMMYFLNQYYDNQREKDLEKIKVVLVDYFNKNSELPAKDGWCGRMVSILHPEVMNEISPYFGSGGIPQDPSRRGTHIDYFYKKVDRDTFVILAKMDNLPSSSEKYNYSGCYDWPGDDIYNYKVEVDI